MIGPDTVLNAAGEAMRQAATMAMAASFGAVLLLTAAWALAALMGRTEWQAPARR